MAPNQQLMCMRFGFDARPGHAVPDEGQQVCLRLALADGAAPGRLAASFALCRSEAPEIGIRRFEVSLSHLLAGLRDEL